MIEIDREIIKKYPKFSPGIYEGEDNDLYKICSLFPDEDQRRNFWKFMNSFKSFPGVLLPIDLLCDQEIYGYKMPFISDAQDISLLVSRDEQDKDVRKIILDIFAILKEIHKYFIFNDIRTSNILIKDDSAIFIDWDLGIIKDTNTKACCYYYTYNISYIGTIFEDIVKAFISALSLFYHYDLEIFMKKHSIFDLRELLLNAKADREIIHTIDIIIDIYFKKRKMEELDVVGLFETIDLPSKREKNRVRKRIKSQVDK